MENPIQFFELSPQINTKNYYLRQQRLVLKGQTIRLWQRKKILHRFHGL